MYGNKITPSEFHPNLSLIGKIEQSMSGNVILRIGRMWSDDPQRGWQQTEHVVLKQMEVVDLVRELSSFLPSGPTPGQETILYRLDRELATLVLAKLNGNTVDDERYALFHERLADFVHPEEP